MNYLNNNKGVKKWNTKKITKKEEWDILSKNKFNKDWYRVNSEEKSRDKIINMAYNSINWLESYNNSDHKDRIFKHNGSNDYIDDVGCRYTKKGQAYIGEYKKLIVIIKDYEFSIGVRMVKKAV